MTFDDSLLPFLLAIKRQKGGDPTKDPWIYLGVSPRIKRIAVEEWLHVRKVGCEKDGEGSIVNVQSKAQLP